MKRRTRILSGYSRPPAPAPEFRVEYLDTPAGPLVLSVYTAMGSKVSPDQHPTFKRWLEMVPEIQQPVAV